MSNGFRNRIQSPYFATGNPETEEMTTLYAPGMLGCVAEFDQGGIAGPKNVCTYQLVLQAAAISGVIGNVLYWGTAALKKAFTVTTTATNTGTRAGICRKLVVTAATYIWMLKQGQAEVLFIDAPTVACDGTGLPVVGVTATAGKADSLALATAPQPAYLGRTLGAQDGVTKRAMCMVEVPDYV